MQKKLSAAGNKVIINGHSEELLQNALKELDNAVAIQGDLTVEADRLRIAAQLKEKHPELNIIINNAAEGFAYLLNQVTDAHKKASPWFVSSRTI